MKYNYLYTLVVLVFIVSSCETNWGKYGGYSMDYGSKFEYYIILDKSDTNFVNELGYTKKGCKITFHKSQGDIDTFCIEKGVTIIESFVDEAEYDERFILVAQKPLEKICDCNYDCLKVKYGGKGQTLKTNKLCEDALEKSKIYDYWIIVKSTNDVYGPLTIKEYNQKRKELKIPDKLKLDIDDK